MPNKTVLEGEVQSVTPEADGFGANLELRVTDSQSVAGSPDALNPALGSVVQVFHARPGQPEVGDKIRVDATLLAGPFGERTVAEKVTQLPSEDDGDS